MTDEERRPGFATRAIHGARTPPVEQDPASVPIYQTSTWRFDTSEDYAEVINFRRHGYVYGRGFGNPTVEAFEGVMADLEGTESAYAFASGMAAVHATATTFATAGDRIVSSTELYGGSYSLFHSVLPRYGIEVTYVSPHDVDAVAAALPGAKLFFVETIANPNCTVADLAALGARCREAGVPSAVDNTFASPYLCNPAALGFDVVLHSATKYVGGHSDLIGGVACGSEETRVALRRTAIDVGGAMEAFPAWLCLRGLVTLPLRIERHSGSAQRVAEFLESHPKVERVHYPGLASHPHHRIALRELRGGLGGGMLAVEVGGGVDAAVRFCDSLKLAWVGTSLGGDKTLVGHAASTTHRQMDPEARRAAGIADGLVRVSVGLEDAEDLVADFDQALEKA
ncbi:MAG: aminotransferase class I/II-fold pyridoxal phosphate-dependent enzyme [Actinomycetota bacterium]|nr:aminotransferase class I/II-fold pyridoxal phosphate-dependent enzyme [Actinomycetota bacterium]